MAAAGVRRQRDIHAGSQRGIPAALDNRGRNFMPGNSGKRYQGVAAAKGVQIASAETHHPDLQQKVVRGQHGFGNGRDLRLPRLSQYQRSQFVVLPVAAGPVFLKVGSVRCAAWRATQNVPDFVKSWDVCRTALPRSLLNIRVSAGREPVNGPFRLLWKSKESWVKLINMGPAIVPGARGQRLQIPENHVSARARPKRGPLTLRMWGEIHC